MLQPKSAKLKTEEYQQSEIEIDKDIKIEDECESEFNESIDFDSF